jgi:hypothetical protein
MRRIIGKTVLLGGLIALSACGGSGGGNVGGGGGGGGTAGTISGRLTGPTGANLNPTAVAALVCRNQCQTQADITETIGGQTVVTTSGSSAQYQLANVPAGLYFVLAYQDTNGSGQVDAGDLVGAVRGVPSPSANVNITLQAASPASAGAFNPAAVARLLPTAR